MHQVIFKDLQTKPANEAEFRPAGRYPQGNQANTIKINNVLRDDNTGIWETAQKYRTELCHIGSTIH